MTEQASEKTRESVGLPVRVFLYTLDQIALITGEQEVMLRKKRVHYDRRSPGPCPRDKLLARNINAPGVMPDWRVAEEELVRWLRLSGFQVRKYDRAFVSS